MRVTLTIKPVEALAHLPDALTLLALFDVGAAAVLLALEPLADVLATIGPLESTMAVLLIVHVLADVLAAIRPSESALAFHLVVHPLAVVDAAIGPDVLAIAVDVILVELAIIGRLIRPDEFSAPVLHALFVVSLVLGTIGPLLQTISVLLVLVPVTLISRAVEVRVDAEAIGLVLGPLSLVDVALRVHEPAEAIGHPVAPKAVIPGAIGPDLDTAAVLLLRGHEPLSLVHGTVLQHLNRLDGTLLGLVDFVDAPVERLKLLDDLLKWLLRVEVIFESLKQCTYQHNRVVVSCVEDLQLLIDEQVYRVAGAVGVRVLLAANLLISRHEDV